MPKRPAEDDNEAAANGSKRTRLSEDGIENHAAHQEPDHPLASGQSSPQRALTNEHYTVGWISAITTEFVAARALLDQVHEGPAHVAVNDNNAYIVGEIGGHNVVIAVLPEGEYGLSTAASVARDMLHTFPNIRIGLMVGIGGGVPSVASDIRLGDVVVSTPRGGNGGVIQYDFGKTIQDQSFRRTRYLNQPPTVLRTAVAALRSKYEMAGHHLEGSIDRVLRTNPRLRRNFARPDPTSDTLYKSWAVHSESSGNCVEVCGDENLVSRRSRREDEDNPAIHYGLIASGNQLMKDAITRDRLATEHDILCFEMEAAGLMNHFPCLVIRGISDYADSHKNKEWQGYAAMTAAAYAKDLLYQIAPTKVEAEKRIIDLIPDIHKGVNELVRAQHSLETRAVLDWLTPLDYWKQQSDNFSRWQPDTGQWLLRSPEYRKWANSEGQTLFCTGIPGAGKTILTSVVVDDLNAKFADDETVGIGFLYCNFRRHHEQRVDDLFASLLKQLSEGLSSLPVAVASLYHNHREKRTRPPHDEIFKTLGLVAAQFTRVFFVIDALDECQVTKAFLADLFHLQTKCKVNIFATSRPIPEIKDKFKSLPHLEISATDEDVRRYLEGRIGQLQSFVQDNRELQSLITASIAEAVDGMFLLAQIYLHSLEDKLTPKDIRSALHHFLKQKPGSSEDQKLQVLSQAYDFSLNRINGQHPGLRELAHRVLSWITCARRPLTNTELQHALAVEFNASCLDEEGFTEVDKLVSVCAGLVTVDEESSIIRLVHYTTQEYFDQMQSSLFPNAEADIANACVTYLSFQAFARGACVTDMDLKQRFQLNPLYRYAAQNWGFHASKTAAGQSSRVTRLLQSRGNVLASAQALMVGQPYSGATRYSQRTVKHLTGVHLAAYFGLNETMAKLLAKGELPDESDSYGQTPLSYASERGHESTVALLLETGAVQVNRADQDARSSLSYAAEGGHSSVVRLLLAAPGCSADNSDADGRTPLSYAAAQGHEVVVGLLSPITSASADSRNQFGRTPLSFASEGGHERVVEIILRYRVFMINIPDVDQRTPLSYCAQGGHEAATKLLLQNGSINPDVGDRENRTPLSYAAQEGHVEIVEALLMNPNVDADSKQRHGRTPLSYAAGMGHTAIVNRLLQARGLDADSRDRGGRTPLSYAAEEGHEEVVALLLSMPGVDSYSTDRTGGTPLLYAEQRRQDAVVKLLRG